MVLDTQIVLKNCVTLRATFKENQQQQYPTWKYIYSSLETILPQKEALDHAKKKQIKVACEIAFMLRYSRCGGICSCECVLVYHVCMCTFCVCVSVAFAHEDQTDGRCDTRWWQAP